MKIFVRVNSNGDALDDMYSMVPLGNEPDDWLGAHGCWWRAIIREVNPLTRHCIEAIKREDVPFIKYAITVLPSNAPCTTVLKQHLKDLEESELEDQVDYQSGVAEVVGHQCPEDDKS